MGIARRERWNKENTFLELVKCSLDELRQEVSEVKWLLNSKGILGPRSSEDLLRPPPPPPALDVFNRDFLLQLNLGNCGKNTEGVGNSSLPKMVKLDYATEQDEITDFLRAQGHYEFDEHVHDLEHLISEAQRQAAILRKTGNNCVPVCSIGENITTAQRQAASFREAEKSGERMTAEAQIRASSIAAIHNDCELPDVPNIDDIGQFVMAHVEVAKKEHRPEHRRPYLQQQFTRIQTKIQITDELEQFLLKVLDRFAPDTLIDDAFRYMCSQCGAKYQDPALRCLVCCSHDVFDAIDSGAYDFARNMMGSNDFNTCERSESSLASSDYADDGEDTPTSFISNTSYPSFMRN